MNKKADEKFLARALSQNVKFTTEKLLESALDEYPPPFWTSEEMPKRSVNFTLLLHGGGEDIGKKSHVWPNFSNYVY